MTPREYEAIVTGLREYRDEEARMAREAMSKTTGQHTFGGETVRNP